MKTGNELQRHSAVTDGGEKGFYLLIRKPETVYPLTLSRQFHKTERQKRLKTLPPRNNECNQEKTSRNLDVERKSFQNKVNLSDTWSRWNEISLGDNEEPGLPSFVLFATFCR